LAATEANSLLRKGKAEDCLWERHEKGFLQGISALRLGKKAEGKEKDINLSLFETSALARPIKGEEEMDKLMFAVQTFKLSRKAFPCSHIYSQIHVSF